MPSGRWGGPALNEIIAEAAEIMRDVVAEAVEEFTAGGYPVGHESVTEVEEYEVLNRWKLSGDERYYDDPEAQERLEELEEVYGRTPMPRAYNQPAIGDGMMQ